MIRVTECRPGCHAARLLRALAVGALVLGAFSPAPRPALGQEPPWRVREKLLGEPRNSEAHQVKDPDRSKKAHDISGIACATERGFPRLCLVVDDESQGAQIVILREGELAAGSFLPLISDSHAGKPMELDAEGVAFGGGAFYVLGSHGRPRHDGDKAEDRARSDARATASRHIFRIRIPSGAVDMATGALTGTGVPEVASSSALVRLIRANSLLAPSLDRPLEENGLTAEGIAVRGERLLIGLRGPVLDGGRAALASIPLATLFDGEAGTLEVTPLDLGRDSAGQARGIRDLATFGGLLLVLAGPEYDPSKGIEIRTGDYSIYVLPDGGAPRRLLDLPGFGAETKPEALLPLDASGEMRALILFDGPDEGAPRVVRLRTD